jgi:hypothetical protein
MMLLVALDWVIWISLVRVSVKYPSIVCVVLLITSQTTDTSAAELLSGLPSIESFVAELLYFAILRCAACPVQHLMAGTSRNVIDHLKSSFSELSPA